MTVDHLNTHPAAGHADNKERAEAIRFAVVLNGGVSLAVWMGGTVLELDRLIKDKGAWLILNEYLSLAVRADVITGTSAGGINGAALALAQVNEHAELSMLRELWSEQGRMESLLRQPFKGSPTSLLRGDDYFLPQLTDAFKRLATPFKARRAEDYPVDLTITTTLLRGAPLEQLDALGQHLYQNVHEGRFHFSRNGDDDAFDAAAHPELAAKLAFASRCTAGFPVAFEPTLVPVDNADLSVVTDGRPNMAGEASWTDRSGEGAGADRSRYVIDGGVLTNTPTKEALRVIGEMPASEPIQRVMMLVFPHAPDKSDDDADNAQVVPTTTGTLAGVMGAWSSQSSRTYVEEIDKHNRKCAARRGARYDVLNEVDGAHDYTTQPRLDDQAAEKGLENLHLLAETLYGHFRRLRRRRVNRDFADRFARHGDETYTQLLESIARAHGPGDSGGGSVLAPYAMAELPAYAEAFRESGQHGASDPSGWEWGLEGAWDICDCCLDLLKRIAWAVPACDLPQIKAARAAIHVARATIRAERAKLDNTWEKDEHRPFRLATLRPSDTYWRARLKLYALRVAGDATGCEEAFDALAKEFATTRDSRQRLPATDQVTELAEALDQVRTGVAPGETGRILHQQVLAALTAVWRVLPIFDRLSQVGDRPGVREVGPWQVLFHGLRRPSAAEQDFGDPSAPLTTDAVACARLMLPRFVWLHVASWTIGDETTEGNSFPIDLVQLSLQTQNSFASVSTIPHQKVGGMSLNRFGGFLKRSWRANDWIWGRLDAATTLTKIVLSAERVRRYRELASQDESPETTCYFRGPAHAQAPDDAAAAWVNGLCAKLFDGWTQPGRWDAPGVAAVHSAAATARTELAELFSSPSSNPQGTSEGLAALAAWALHMDIILEELPKLEDAIRADTAEGGNTRSRGEALLAQREALLGRVRRAGEERALQGPGAPITADHAAIAIEALTAFDRARIGHEDMMQEGSSDQMIRTATTAAAVVVTVLDSDNSGLKAARPVTRALRGLMLLPFWAIRALTSGGPAARYLALMTFAFGAVLLSLAILGVLPSWLSGVGATAGVGALLGAFAYGAFRSGTFLHGFVLLTPIVPIIAIAIQRATESQEASSASATKALVSAGVILALVLGLVILGSLPSPLGSFLASYDGLATRLGTTLTARFGRRDRRQLAREAAARRPLVTQNGSAPGAWRKNLLRVLPVLFILAVGVLATAAALLGARFAAELVEQLRSIAGRSTRDTLVGGLVVGAPCLVLGALLGWRGGCSLREFHPPARVETESGTTTWEVVKVQHPAGVTASWSVCYGVIYLLAAATMVALADERSSTPYLLTALTLLVYAVVLLVGIPWLMPRRARIRIENDIVLSLARHPGAGEWDTDPDPEPQDRTLTWLVERFPAYRFLVRQARSSSQTDTRGLAFTGRGNKLFRRAKTLRSMLT